MKYLIDYNYGTRKNKQIKINNCVSSDDAKYRLSGYLFRKYGEDKLEVLLCERIDTDERMDAFGGVFKDIFK